MSASVVWLIVLAVMLVIEIITLGLTTIWFGLGAAGAAIVAWLGFGIWIQLAVFAVVSVIAMALCRPFAMKFMNRAKEKTNVEDVVGKTVLVSEAINNERAVGQVKLNGVEWTARSEDDSIIPENERVTIVAVEGVKLIVK